MTGEDKGIEKNKSIMCQGLTQTNTDRKI